MTLGIRAAGAIAVPVIDAGLISRILLVKAGLFDGAKNSDHSDVEFIQILAHAFRES